MHLPGWLTKERVGQAVWTISVAASGFFFHDVVDFRNKQNEATNAVVESVRQANDDVAKLMLHFDQLALKGTPVSSADRQAFSEAIVKAYAASARLKDHVPSVEPAVDKYELSLVDLKKGAESLEGPSNGRGYVEAASRFLADQSQLEKSVAENKRSYFRMLVFNEL